MTHSPQGGAEARVGAAMASPVSRPLRWIHTLADVPDALYLYIYAWIRHTGATEVAMPDGGIAFGQKYSWVLDILERNRPNLNTQFAPEFE